MRDTLSAKHGIKESIGDVVELLKLFFLAIL